MLHVRRMSYVLIALLGLALLAGGPAAPALAAGPSGDLSGHWAQLPMQELADLGILAGLPDGSMGPDQPVSRAEYMAMINRALNFTASADTAYKDVNSGDWFAADIARASAAGYIQGYSDGTIRPDQLIQRQEMAAMLVRALNLPLRGTEALARCVDSEEIPAWSAPACAALAADGYISGCADGAFQPLNTTTRAMAATILHKAVQQRTMVCAAAGIYGPAEGTENLGGNVLVQSGGVTLQNLIISGNLIITAAVGQAGVTTDNVTVMGRTIVMGGDTNLNGTYAAIYMQEDGGRITLNGEVTVLEVSSPTAGAYLDITGGHIGSVTIAAGTRGTKVNVASGAVIDVFYSYAALDATGSGQIGTSYIYASGITSTLNPGTRIIAAGVQPPVVPNLPVQAGGRSSNSSRPVLTGVKLGDIIPSKSGTSAAPVLTFDVDSHENYSSGRAYLSRDCEYLISSEIAPFFNLSGEATTDDDLMQMAMDLLDGNGGDASDGIMGSSLQAFSDVTIVLSASGKETVYTIRFI